MIGFSAGGGVDIYGRLVARYLTRHIPGHPTVIPQNVPGAQGVSAIDPATMGKLTKEGDWELERYTFDESTAQVQFLNEDVALVAYKVKEKLTVDGKPVNLEANDSSVWIRKDGEWLCAMHTESLAGDPFGRDKTAKTT